MTPISSDAERRTALFAGSFDPFTVGHASVVERALPLFDRLVIAVGINAEKATATAAAYRVAAIAGLYAGDGRVEVMSYSGELTADLARRIGAGWLLRGVRSVRDFEYERDMADLNRRLSGIETVVLFSLPEHGAVSSSAVREIASYGGDVAPFLPERHS